MAATAAAVTVGFVGLGRMGAPMAAHLCKVCVSGRCCRLLFVCRSASACLVMQAARVLVWARDAAKATAHSARHGSVAVAAPQDLAAASVLFTCLPTSAEVASVVRAVGPGRGAVVVDCTSGDPAASRALAAALADTRGCAFVDAPVSGGVTGAEAGTLTVMAGGDAAALARVTPLLRTFAAHIVHAGATPGAGHALKSVNNLLKYRTVSWGGGFAS